MKEVIDVNVSFDTSFEDIELLRLEMEKFIRSPDNSRDFQPDIAIGVGGVGDCDKLTLKIAIKHKSNWHNDAVRATRRSKFMCALTLALKKVPINGPGGGGDALGGPANPTYSVAVTDDFAITARAKSDEDKKAKKLANQPAEQQTSADAAKTAAEQRAAEHLNTSDPVTEALDDWGYEHTTVVRERASMDRTRSPEATSTGVSTSRSDALSARESQRGRRKAGDTLPPMAPLGEDMPAVHLTRTSESSARGGDNRSFDVERHAGAGATPAASPYNTWTVYNSQAVSPGQGQGTSAGVQGPYPPPAGSPPVADPTHLAPSSQGAVPGRALVGARSRGSSVSGPQPGQQGGAPGPSGQGRY